MKFSNVSLCILFCAANALATPTRPSSRWFGTGNLVESRARRSNGNKTVEIIKRRNPRIQNIRLVSRPEELLESSIYNEGKKKKVVVLGGYEVEGYQYKAGVRRELETLFRNSYDTIFVLRGRNKTEGISGLAYSVLNSLRHEIASQRVAIVAVLSQAEFESMVQFVSPLNDALSIVPTDRTSSPYPGELREPTQNLSAISRILIAAANRNMEAEYLAFEGNDVTFLEMAELAFQAGQYLREGATPIHIQRKLNLIPGIPTTHRRAGTDFEYVLSTFDLSTTSGVIFDEHGSGLPIGDRLREGYMPDAELLRPRGMTTNNPFVMAALREAEIPPQARPSIETERLAGIRETPALLLYSLGRARNEDSEMRVNRSRQPEIAQTIQDFTTRLAKQNDEVRKALRTLERTGMPQERIEK